MKRRRTSLACTICRRRKTRCDGQRPSCSPCLRAQSTCVYEEVAAESDALRVPNRAELVQKVKDLESMLKLALTNKDVAAPIASAGNIENETPTSYQPTLTNTESSMGPSAIGIESDEEATVDIQATETFEESTESDRGYFGPSSNHAFFRSLSDVFTQTLRTTAYHTHNQEFEMIRPAPNNTQRAPSSSFNTSVNIHSTTWSAPKEESQLLEYYFSYIEPMLPFLNKALLISDLKTLQRRDIKEDETKRARLHIIFALAAAAVDRNRSFSYYKQSLNYLTTRKLRGASIDLLQTLVLMVSYQQNNQLSITSWTYHALAVKTAFQLGLQSPLAYKEHGEQERAMRQRLWFSLVNQDRVLSMCLGRPCLIPQQYVRIQKPEMPDISSNSTSTHSQHLQGLIYHVELIRLHEIIASILSQLYDDNIDNENRSNAQTAISVRLPLQWRLETWAQNLHSSCRMIADDISAITYSSQNHRFRLMLSVHYYRALLLLNAPAVLGTLRESLIKSPEQDWDILLENTAPVVRHEYRTLQNLHRVMCILVSHGMGFIDNNCAWFSCNYTCLTVSMHLFGLLLFSYAHPTFMSSVGVSSLEIHKLLKESLNNMLAVGGSSIMTSKAHTCMTRFLEIFNATNSGQNFTPESFGDLSTSQTSGYGHEFDFSHNIAEVVNDFLDVYDYNDVFAEGFFGGTSSTTWNNGQS